MNFFFYPLTIHSRILLAKLTDTLLQFKVVEVCQFRQQNTTMSPKHVSFDLGDHLLKSKMLEHCGRVLGMLEAG